MYCTCTVHDCNTYTYINACSVHVQLCMYVHVHSAQYLYITTLSLSLPLSLLPPPSAKLLVAGVVDEEVGCTLLMDMLTTVTKADKDGHPYLSVVLNFARHCSEDLAGILPRRHRQLMRKFKVELPESQV